MQPSAWYALGAMNRWSKDPYVERAQPDRSRPMACKACASANLQKLTGELSASFSDVRRANISPVYVCQEVVVCLDCGFTELIIPTSELEQLKKGSAASAT